MFKTCFTYLTIFSLITSQLFAVENPGFTEVELSSPVSSSNPLAKMEAGEGAKEKSAQPLSPSDEDKSVHTPLLQKQYAERNDHFAAKMVTLFALFGLAVYYIFSQGRSTGFNHTQAANPTPDPGFNFGPGGWWGR